MNQLYVYRILLLIVSLLTFGQIAYGQTAQVTGIITDSSAASVPGASITVTNADTGINRKAISTEDGNYTIPLLPPGTYNIQVQKEGFRAITQSDLNLQLEQVARLNFTLEIGQLTEQVNISGAAASLLESETSSIGKVVDNRRIGDLPLNTRNVYSLIFLTPGVAGSIGNNYGDLNYSVNGARPRAMDTLIDGLTASFPTVNGGAGISVFPSVDAIQEFKVMGATYPAEFGRSQGSVLNVVYKSGTNDLHGSTYEFLRNSVFDANNFFENRRGSKLGSFKRSQFGGTLGGPIKHDKAFFMFSYEGLRERSFRTSTFTVPTLLERQGDFSKTFAQNGQLIRVFNPFTTRRNPSGSGFIRDPFLDNRIPSSMMDPVALNVLKYYPLPNQPGEPITGRNNYSSSGSQAINIDNYDVRIDHRFSDQRTFFARYSHRFTESAPPKFFPEPITIAEGRVIEENHGRNVVAEYTHIFSPTTILTARLGFSRTLFVFSNQGLGFVPSSLGLPTSIDTAVDRQMFPGFGASNYVSLGGNDHRFNAFMSYPLVISLTKIHNQHTFKYGFEGRMIRVNVWEARSAGTFNFSAGFTQGPNPSSASSTAGNSIASLLLGTGTSNNVLIQGWKNVASQNFYYAGYAQDDWRVTPRLTLNLGVRYDVESPRTERYNRFNYFDPLAPSPLAQRVPQFRDLRGGVVFAGVDGNSRYQYKWDNNNIAPRLGLAYQLNQHTVIRAGYSHVFGASPQAAQGTVGPFGFRTENPWVTTLDGITPLNLLSNPYPQGFRPLPGSSEGLLTQVGANLQAPLEETLTPWSQQWNVNVQRELPGQISLEVAYVGTRGLQLARNGEGGLNINQLDPQYMALGSRLNELVDNPFFGIVNNGVLAASRVSRAQLLRPYPQFTEIVPLFSSGASSIYHSLQVTASKRLSRGLLFEGSYTWAKLIEEGQNHQDSYNIRGSRALSSIDLAHRFVVSYLYEFPFGRGRRFGAKSPGIVDFLIGGWQFNGITTFQTGTPLSISASNTAGIFNPLTRPNNNGRSGRLDGPVHERLNRYFDTSVFSQPLPFTFGNVSATLPDIRNDGIRNFDLSLFKTFAPYERLRVQFRAEALNAFNTPRFGSPDTNVNSGSFGVINSQANAPRQVQFALKLLW